MPNNFVLPPRMFITCREDVIPGLWNAVKIGCCGSFIRGSNLALSLFTSPFMSMTAIRFWRLFAALICLSFAMYQLIYVGLFANFVQVMPNAAIIACVYFAALGTMKPAGVYTNWMLVVNGLGGYMFITVPVFTILFWAYRWKEEMSSIVDNSDAMALVVMKYGILWGVLYVDLFISSVNVSKYAIPNTLCINGILIAISAVIGSIIDPEKVLYFTSNKDAGIALFFVFSAHIFMGAATYIIVNIRSRLSVKVEAWRDDKERSAMAMGSTQLQDDDEESL